jgi:hypothetical protein
VKINPIVSLLFAALVACGSSDNSSSTPNQAHRSHQAASQDSAGSSSGGLRAVAAGNTGLKLLEDCAHGTHTYDITPNRGDGLGNMSVARDGKSVWPPAGPGCPQLVTCCEQLTALEDAMALACLLAMGRDQDCATAKSTVWAIAQEHRLAMPDSCQ